MAIPKPLLNLDLASLTDPADATVKSLLLALAGRLPATQAAFSTAFAPLLSGWWDSLPTSAPAGAKTFWNNGGILARTD